MNPWATMIPWRESWAVLPIGPRDRDGTLRRPVFGAEGEARQPGREADRTTPSHKQSHTP